jgi:hypothetical protein
VAALALDEVVIEVQKAHVYLPQVAYVRAPDLVVQSLKATRTDIQVVILNQGNWRVDEMFYVDVYVDPHTLPIEVNKEWKNLAREGLAWQVPAETAASALVPGGMLTLTYSMKDGFGAYPWENGINWPLDDQSLYVQVDSFSPDGYDYGNILETHEIVDGPYNNILGPVSPTATMVMDAGPSVECGEHAKPNYRPLRP